MKGGYIGQKGIGFKSVFKVSDQPEIRSAGFSFKFDAKQGPVGYILPQWVEEEEDEMESGEEKKIRDTKNISVKDETSSASKWTTRIRLPLTADRCLETQSGILDIHPTLLLFLRRLASIRVLNVRANSNVFIERVRRNVGKAEILTLTTNSTVRDGASTAATAIVVTNTTDGTTTTTDWLLARKRLSLSELPSSYVSRPADQIRFTELVLAFPLADVGKDDMDEEILPPSPLPIFAFLPLRSYGFNFVIQGEDTSELSNRGVKFRSTHLFKTVSYTQVS